jgi:preprotein translocase subunit SecA
VLESLIKMAAAAPPAANSTPEEQQQWQQNALAASIDSLKQINAAQLEQVLYVNFGCKTDLREFRADPAGCLEHLKHVVPLSLTEQRERLLDLVDEVVGTMVEHACPQNKHAEEWDFAGLDRAYQEMFGIEATGVEKIIGGQTEIAEKLYNDAEGVIKRREKEVGELIYLRVLRNFYLQEIDNQWLEHLQNMEALRDGIGLRGYGQRDPKKEYQKEGFDLFLELMQNVKASVVQKMFHFVIDRPDEVERLEAERRRRVAERQQKMQASHAAAAAATAAQDGEGDGAAGEDQAVPAAASRRQRRRMAAMGQPAEAAPAPKAQTVKRDKPKLGRNDPCWCGSGKKYKNCHLRSDEEGSGAAEPRA